MSLKTKIINVSGQEYKIKLLESRYDQEFRNNDLEKGEETRVS